MHNGENNACSEKVAPMFTAEELKCLRVATGGGRLSLAEVIKMLKERESILTEAARIRGGGRNADYGDAVENFRRITEIANAITGLELTPAQCCKVMIAVKLARERHNHKRDNLVDLCGYADILELIEESNKL